MSGTMTMPKKNPKKIPVSDIPADLSKRGMATARLYKDVIDKLLVVATRRGISLADLVDPTLSAFADTEFAIEAVKMMKEIEDRK
jgi:hypothetical protein